MRDEALKDQVGDNLETILDRLPRVAAWCWIHADRTRPESSLRSAKLMPQFFAADRKEMVEEVDRKRQIELLRYRESVSEPLRLKTNGRLFVSEPDVAVLSCNLPQSETSGYFDDQNIPPWDTWVAYFSDAKRSYLLSYAPDEFRAPKNSQSY